MIARLICIFLTLLSVHGEAAELVGRVVGVADGDTITVLDAHNVQHKIRLAGIDAPEKSQGYGQVSKSNLSDMVYDKNVQVSWSKLDRYGRVIGKVILNGRDLNLEQINKGLAWHYKKYENEQSESDRITYRSAEARARNLQIGLWAEPNPIAPWDFRKRKKNQH